MSIEGNVSEQFSGLPKNGINASTESFQCHAMFHYFLSDDSKQYAATNTAQIKRLIELFKKQKFCRPHYVQYGKNTDGCAEQYRCSS